jgi:hypothetical protein
MVEDCFGLFLILRDETLFSPRTVIPFQSAGEARMRSLLAAGAVLVFGPLAHSRRPPPAFGNTTARQFHYLQMDQRDNFIISIRMVACRT